jgi:tRNA-2-methylthio-N6-dimethylallyladenosine synthase
MKYYFWILGCAMNYSDAERISAVLDSFGFQKTEKEKEADIVCVIACSVRQHAVDRIFGKIKEWKTKPNLTTILSGCVLGPDRKKLEKEFDLIFEIKDIDKLIKVLDTTLSRHSRPDRESIQIENMDSRLRGNDREEGLVSKTGIPSEFTPSGARNDKILSGEYLSIIPHYDSSFRAYIPVSTGCDNFCTYCAVPYTRGREKSRSMSEIINEIKNLIKNDYKEITLLGQNVNSYGNDWSYSSSVSEKSSRKDNSSHTSSNNRFFIELIKKIDHIPGDYRVYFYSNHPKDMTDELINVLLILKHFPHYLHLPLQSGSDEILKKMNRHYTQRQYLDLVKKIRTVMSDVALTTDIIVGFPNETKKQFEDTVKVMKEVKFDMAYISQYSPRPGTVSAKIKDNISREEKQNREKILQKILAVTAMENNQKIVGKTIKVLIDEAKKDKLYGRTGGYKVVEIKKSPTVKIGDFVEVKIESASAWKLTGYKK